MTEYVNIKFHNECMTMLRIFNFSITTQKLDQISQLNGVCSIDCISLIISKRL